MFVLALAVGRVLAAQKWNESLVPLLTLLLVATLTSILERELPDRHLVWAPPSESVLVVAVLASTQAHADELLVYLAVPPLVAGLRHGWVAALNTTFAGGLTLALIWTAVSPLGRDVATTALFWLAVGLGTGLLAGWQTRTLRAVEERQAPQAVARALMGELHDLATRGAVGLDSSQIADELVESVCQGTGAEAAAILAQGPAGMLSQLAAVGASTGLARHVLAPSDSGHGVGQRVLVLPLAPGGHLAGWLVSERTAPWDSEAVARATSIVDDYALRMETAVLFDDVRDVATADERNRIARDIHDGVAQEMVALGFIVDDIDATSTEPVVRDQAQRLRAEITRIISELRYSIFDLRHQVADHRFSGAVTEYAHQLGVGSDLKVHVKLDESGPALSARFEAELLRIAQEALSNVRRHARAANVWVRFTSDGNSVSLDVEDDGVGDAAPRDRHWGLQTMHERARGIGATLTVAPAQTSGTVVRLRYRRDDLRKRKAT